MREWWAKYKERRQRRNQVAKFLSQPHILYFEEWEAEKVLFGDCVVYPIPEEAWRKYYA